MAGNRSGQLNIRVSPTFATDLAIIQREHNISDRSNATRFAVRREAQRIRRRKRSTTK